MKTRHRLPSFVSFALGLALSTAGPSFAEGAKAGAQEDPGAALTEQAFQRHAEGNDVEAVALLERALALQEKAFGKDHPTVALTLRDLGVLATQKADFARAEAYLKRAWVIQEKALGPDDLVLSKTLQNLAQLYIDKGQLSDAEPLFVRALAVQEKALGPDHPAVGVILNDLADLYHVRGDLARAESLYGRALAIWRTSLGADHPHVAAALNNLAEVRKDKADMKGAEPLYLEAIAIWRKQLGPNHPNVASGLVNLSGLYEKEGDFQRAEPLLVEGIAIQEKALGEDHPTVAGSLGHLARVYVEKGDYLRAEALYERAIRIQRKTLGDAHPSLARTLNDYAVMLVKRGDLDAAQDRYTEALHIWRVAYGPQHPQVATVLNNIGMLFLDQGKDAEAEPVLLQALAITKQALGEEHPDNCAILNNLGNLEYERHHFDKAREYFEKALQISMKAYGGDTPRNATFLLNIGACTHENGNPGFAGTFYQRALDIEEKVMGPMHPSLSNILQHMAVAALETGRPQMAIQWLRRAADIDEHYARLLLDTGSQVQKRAFMNTLVGGTFINVSAHLQGAPDDKDALALSFETILRRKGRVLDASQEAFAALRKRLAPADRSALDELGSVQSEIARTTLRGPAGRSREEHEGEVFALYKRAQELEAAISRRGGELHANDASATISQIAAALPEGSALVEFALYFPIRSEAKKLGIPALEARYVAYVLRRGAAPAFADLGKASSIDAMVEEARDIFADPAKDPKPIARALEAILLKPIRPLLGNAKGVFLSPDAALNLLPFGALMDDDGRYAVETLSFTYLTSGRDLLRQAAPRPSKERSITIVANPDFGPMERPAKESPEGGTRGIDMSKMRFSPLSGTGEEASAIHARLPRGQVLVGGAATERAVKSLVHPEILHLATHGFFISEKQMKTHAKARGLELDATTSDVFVPPSGDPLLRSGVALTGANLGNRGEGEEDGVLTALEVAGMDLDGTKLVVLSACETGVGEASYGEGVYGLRRALLLAGAETQVMSLWKVDDEATRDLMVSYYDGLQGGKGRSESMRDVQVGMVAQKERSHPFYWASFIVSGNPSSLDGLAETPGKVAKGPRGCACSVADASDGVEGLGMAGLGVLAISMRRARKRKTSARLLP